ncbi:FHA domain-containing protein [Thalassoglobus sp.]|uniref:FHA domain-containing protein n=1 Tax=Thalassoglobus sp. TaxID=2795869 RepID=UPI003AA97186
MLQAELRVLSGKHAGSTIPLPVGKFLIGREEDCHLRPNSDLVSRHHCVFTLDEYGLRFRDLGSTNGSFVNREQIRGAVVLNPGDAVSVGKLEFQVILGDPITDETRTNLANDMPTEIISPTGEPSGAPADADSSSSSEFETAPDQTLHDSELNEASASDTLINIPTQPMPAEGQSFPPAGDTQFYPQPGGMPPQMPVGYPPQMGYPQGMMPYGYPGYPQQMGYPPQQMGYPPNMYPQQQYPPQQPGQPGQPEAVLPQEGAAADSGAELAFRLPDPSETGVKAPPPAPPAAEGEAEKEDGRTADQKAKEEAPSAAADAIQQYLQRRPKTNG